MYTGKGNNEGANSLASRALSHESLKYLSYFIFRIPTSFKLIPINVRKL